MSENNRNKDDANDNDPLGQIFGMLFGAGGQQPQAGGSAAGSQNMSSMGFDPAMLGGIMQQLQGLFSGGGASQAATRAALEKVPTPDPAVSDEVQRSTQEAFRIAELWLGGVVDEPAAVSTPRAVTRREWVDLACEDWLEIVTPIRENMNSALMSSLTEQMPEEMKPMLGQVGGMFGSMSDMMFGAQLGELLGALSGTVLNGTEFGLPVIKDGVPVLVESNIAGEAAEQDFDTSELRIYLAVTELAQLWLFAQVPWLTGHVRTALAKYADGISVDTEKISGLAAGGLDPSRLEEMGDELRQGMFKPQRTPDQLEALETLQTVLSVIAGWAEVVTFKATAQLPNREAIRDALRNRAVTRSSADVALEEFIGLNLQPTRLREAASLFAYLESEKGAEARDDVFRHPDMLPTARDLDDPLGYYERRTQEWSTDSSMDEALAKLLAEETGGADAGRDESAADEDDVAADPKPEDEKPGDDAR